MLAAPAYTTRCGLGSTTGEMAVSAPVGGTGAAESTYQVGGPVVGKVLAVAAGSATRQLSNVFKRHASIESIATNDLVLMGRGNRPGVDERVDSVDHELVTAEAEHGRPGSVEGREIRRNSSLLPLENGRLPEPGEHHHREKQGGRHQIGFFPKLLLSNACRV